MEVVQIRSTLPHTWVNPHEQQALGKFSEAFSSVDLSLQRFWSYYVEKMDVRVVTDQQK